MAALVENSVSRRRPLRQRALSIPLVGSRIVNGAQGSRCRVKGSDGAMAKPPRGYGHQRVSLTHQQGFAASCFPMLGLCPEAASCIKDQGLLPFPGIDSALKSIPDRLPALPLATAIQASYDLQALFSCRPPPVLSYCMCRRISFAPVVCHPGRLEQPREERKEVDKFRRRNLAYAYEMGHAELIQ